jgi:hypothetical protein
MTTLTDELRRLEQQAWETRIASGDHFSRSLLAHESGVSKSALSGWIDQSRTPRDSGKLLLVVRVLAEWAGQGAPAEQNWLNLWAAARKDSGPYKDSAKQEDNGTERSAEKKNQLPRKVILWTAAAVAGALISGFFSPLGADLVGFVASGDKPSAGAGSASTPPLRQPSADGSRSSASGLPAISSSAPPVSGAKRQKNFTYTVYPQKYAPAPVPELTVARGDVIKITAISGQWTCATSAGPAGIQGNLSYTAVIKSWAVPSAPLCSLIGKIGHGPWQRLGGKPRFVSDRSGPLALTTNDLMPENCKQPPSATSCYTDNEGMITILISVSRT